MAEILLLYRCIAALQTTVALLSGYTIAVPILMGHLSCYLLSPPVVLRFEVGNENVSMPEIFTSSSGDFWFAPF